MYDCKIMNEQTNKKKKGNEMVNINRIIEYRDGYTEDSVIV